MKLVNLIPYIVSVISGIQNVWAYESVAKPSPTPYHDWDYLMYSQRWAITACSEWEESKPGNNCSMPPDKNSWIVHGVWPTKIGTEGPLFCPSAVHFDPGQLAPMLADLEARWTNVEANTKPLSFWKHEWDKHGTCSVTLPALDSVSSFFAQGLRWNEQFRLSEILARGGINPGKEGYTPRQIFDAVKAATKADPMVQCAVDRRSKASMISEIRICFDKAFGVIDCDRTNPNSGLGGDVLGNCDAKKPVMYLDQLPAREASFEMDYVDEVLRRRYREQMYYLEVYRAYESVAKPSPTPYHDWDYLMYSQRWAITACSEWEESKPGNNCSMPPDKNSWIVHGVWPTKIGTEGPLFCPSAVHFDPGQLAPMLADLEARWTNVEANTKPLSFWKHEWDKHGTCSVTLPALDSVSSFFAQGLRWNEQFRLSEILARGGINPGKEGYTPRQIFDAVKAATKADPMVQCAVDRRSKASMISEIRICFDKAFGVIDCDRTNPNSGLGGDVLGNCDAKKPVMYLDQLPAREASFEMDYVDEVLRRRYREQMYYLEVYRFLKFLSWFAT